MSKFWTEERYRIGLVRSGVCEFDPQNRRLVVFLFFFIVFFPRFDLKSTGEADGGGKVKAGSSTSQVNYIFIYLNLDLESRLHWNCFNKVLSSRQIFERAVTSSDVNLRMTYCLCGKQFRLAFMSTFCYFVITCDTIWSPLSPLFIADVNSILHHNIDLDHESH